MYFLSLSLSFRIVLCECVNGEESVCEREGVREREREGERKRERE